MDCSEFGESGAARGLSGLALLVAAMVMLSACGAASQVSAPPDTSPFASVHGGALKALRRSRCPVSCHLIACANG